MKCEHYFCRCQRAAELAAMGLTREAIETHQFKVECRMADAEPLVAVANISLETSKREGTP